MNTVGERLKAARMKKGLKQSEVAAVLKCAPTSLTNWENDKIQPSFEILARLCEVLEISPLDLLDRQYLYDDIVEISAKPLYERTYEEKIALNFTRFNLQEQIQAERDNVDYIEQRTGLSTAAVAALTGKGTFDYVLRDVGDDEYDNKITTVGLDGLNRLLSTPQGLKALEAIAYILNSGTFYFADGSKTVRIETGAYADNWGKTNSAMYITADMVQSIHRDELLRLLEAIKIHPEKEELEAAKKEFHNDMSKRKGG